MEMGRSVSRSLSRSCSKQISSDDPHTHTKNTTLSTLYVLKPSITFCFYDLTTIFHFLGEIAIDTYTRHQVVPVICLFIVIMILLGVEVGVSVDSSSVCAEDHRHGQVGMVERVQGFTCSTQEEKRMKQLT